MTDISKPIPTSELTAALVEKVSDFVSVELRLLRAEVAESSIKAISGVGWLAAGFAFLLGGVLMLLAGAGALLVSLGTQPDLACLIVAMAAIAIGLALSAKAMRGLKSVDFTPARSLEQIASVGDAIKNGSHRNE
jgi:hypothetical protein